MGTSRPCQYIKTRLRRTDTLNFILQYFCFGFIFGPNVPLYRAYFCMLTILIIASRRMLIFCYKLFHAVSEMKSTFIQYTAFCYPARLLPVKWLHVAWLMKNDETLHVACKGHLPVRSSPSPSRILPRNCRTTISIIRITEQKIQILFFE